ncbi:hypothetical protein DFS34DRAFT_644132 [Phlyctochytrium arcticum]|nr:hypothetical protein DFS34DRAFT_644132 [Phlyctochytrium arcticum]
MSARGSRSASYRHDSGSESVGEAESRSASHSFRSPPSHMQSLENSGRQRTIQPPAMSSFSHPHQSISYSHSHPLLSLQLDPLHHIVPSDVSMPSTILPDDLGGGMGGVEMPPAGDYAPFYVVSPEKGGGQERHQAASRSNRDLSRDTRMGSGDGMFRQSIMTDTSRAGETWEGPSGSLGATPSEYAAASIANADDDCSDEGMPDCEGQSAMGDEIDYDMLIQRVEEALGLQRDDFEDEDLRAKQRVRDDCAADDAEADLLRKVHEILQSCDGELLKGGEAEQTIVGLVKELHAARRTEEYTKTQKSDPEHMRSEHTLDEATLKHVGERRSIASSQSMQDSPVVSPLNGTSKDGRSFYTSDTDRFANSIDFSLADGTYLAPNPSSRKGSTAHIPQPQLTPLRTSKSDWSRTHHNTSNSGSNLHSTSHHSQHRASITAAEVRSNLDRISVPSRSSNIGGLVGASQPNDRSTSRSIADRHPIHVPKIEYESFFGDGDTMVEKALEPLLAKYLTSADLHATSFSNDQGHARQSLANRSLADSTMFSSTSSISFSDQLSFASRDYMQKYGLASRDTYSGPSDSRRDLASVASRKYGSVRGGNGSRSSVADKGGSSRREDSMSNAYSSSRPSQNSSFSSFSQHQTTAEETYPADPSFSDIDESQSVLQQNRKGYDPSRHRERESRVLDVERIRRLPKLGMPDQSA